MATQHTEEFKKDTVRYFGRIVIYKFSGQEKTSEIRNF